MESFRKLSLFGLAKRRLRGGLVAACNYLKDDYKEQRAKVFLWVANNKETGKSRELQFGSCWTLSTDFFPRKVMQPWDGSHGSEVQELRSLLFSSLS